MIDAGRGAGGASAFLHLHRKGWNGIINQVDHIAKQHFALRNEETDGVLFGVPARRISLVTGHYGSGKTEFAVNLALRLRSSGKKVALVDLDIANVYFRSRERRDMLAEQGIEVYGSAFSHEITAELPAISAGIRRPLEDPDCTTVVDVGGNDSGARILRQFGKYFTPEAARHLLVFNANRPETATLEGALTHIERIRAETGLEIDGLVNNTHLLLETSAGDIRDGVRASRELAENIGIPLACHCCVESLLAPVNAALGDSGEAELIFPMQLYMRPTWLDR